MRVLDLFSGIGGFSLGLERAGMETVAFCEFDKKAQLVLKKHWPDVPIFDDVRELTYAQIKKDGIVSNPKSTGTGANKRGVRGLPKRCSTQSQGLGNGTGRNQEHAIDLICGGFPCLPYSVAGKQRGKEDDRHLWPEYFRLIQEIRPRWVIGENVAGLISLGLDQVLSDLESENYSTETFVIPACAVNAPHRRDRVWIVAHNEGGVDRAYNSQSIERQEQKLRTGPGRRNVPKRWGTSNVSESCERSRGVQADDTQSGRIKEGEILADTNGKRGCGRHTRWEDAENAWQSSRCEKYGPWDVEPPVGRVAHGVPRRVDRLKQLGNAVVPQVVEQIGRAIMDVEAMTYSTENCAKGL